MVGGIKATAAVVSDAHRRRRAALAFAIAAVAVGSAPVGALAAKGKSTSGSNGSSTAATSPSSSGALTTPGSTSPFAPLSPIQVPTTQATTPAAVNQTVTSNSAGGGLSGTDALLIAVGAAAVLAGVAYFIWYDSKRHANARAGAVAAVGARGGSKTPQKSRKLSPAERRRRKRGRAR